MINPWQNTRSCMPGEDRSSGAGIFITAFYAWAAITWNCSHETRPLFTHPANVYNLLVSSQEGRQFEIHLCCMFKDKLSKLMSVYSVCIVWYMIEAFYSYDLWDSFWFRANSFRLLVVGWNERIIRCFKVEGGLKGLKSPPGLHFHHSHPLGSLSRFLARESRFHQGRVDWRLLALKFSPFPQEQHLFYIFARNNLLEWQYSSNGPKAHTEQPIFEFAKVSCVEKILWVCGGKRGLLHLFFFFTKWTY